MIAMIYYWEWGHALSILAVTSENEMFSREETTAKNQWDTRGMNRPGLLVFKLFNSFCGVMILYKLKYIFSEENLKNITI